jgi:nucleoside-diphosphate-sugar epimerase
MKSALIGYTGFVGSTLARQRAFDSQYNSKNIRDIAGHHFDLIVCAGAPAEKWKANAEPEQDRASLGLLSESLGKCTAERVILISTIDVYANPDGVDEATPIDPAKIQPYGRHRYELEVFVAQRFAKTHVIRLPGLFGQGLKKNLIFDLLNEKLDWTDHRSQLQFYDLSRLWDDLQQVVAANLPLANFATAPVLASNVARRCFDFEYSFERDQPPPRYDMRTRFAEELGGSGHYLYDADETFRRIRQFVADQRKTAASGTSEAARA